MIATILVGVLPVLVKIFGMVLDGIGARREVKEAFLAFVGSLSDSQLLPATIKEDYEAQLERLKNEGKPQ